MTKQVKPLVFSDKFDMSDDPTDTRGMAVLTTVGCMRRHELSRDEMMNTTKENIMRSMSYRNREERNESNLLSEVATLLKQGYKLSAVDQSLEDFVARCNE